ncbi:hypothetical protein NEOLEDRAFT_924336 [Neolentinus lepideus HHB14362 ss-1]|uniref:G-protein coupled receptors family 1 profile domain-containing protein n=1 Tax=Neolentinus lepideus HHB14362 ss-1 TaxID=1314782 RepID=A0A165NMR0_9AGAM|nr:hypothetical protein NEOLEDRAFT_924336 [Neolentinus lepideus HHB14362 ss-1]
MTSWYSTQRGDFIAFWVMSLLLGVYAVIFAASLYFLLGERRSSRNHMYLVPTTATLFIMAAAQVVVQFLLLLLTKFSEDATLAQMMDTNNLLETVNLFFTVTNNLIADCLLTWRCYNICSRKIITVAAPSMILFIATVAGYTAFGLSIKFITLTRGISAQDMTAAEAILRLYKIFTGVFYGATAVGNFLLTILIAAKIRRTTKRIKESSSVIETSSYMRIIAILVESSVAHTACLLFAAIFTVHQYTDMTGRYIIVSAAAGISAGAGPTMIIFMLAIDKTIEHRTDVSTALVFNRPSLSTPVLDIRGTRPGSDSNSYNDKEYHYQYQMQSAAV